MSLRQLNEPPSTWNLKRRRVAGLSWKSGERSGPIVAIDGSNAARTRARRIADLRSKAAEAAGWSYEAGPKDAQTLRRRSRRATPEEPRLAVGRRFIDREPFRFRIDARGQRLPHGVTADELRSRRRGESISQAPGAARQPENFACTSCR